MPFAEANGINIHYRIDEPDQTPNSKDLIVLINGLADDLATWDYQIPAFLSAGYRVLRYDNRGIGSTSRPPGPYSAELLAADLHALLTHPDLAHLPAKFHLLGVSMGGMIAQSYALAYPNQSSTSSSSGYEGQEVVEEEEERREILTLSLCCTYAETTPFLDRMFDLWADMAQRMSVRDVMRDVTLWAFTVPFFRTRSDDLAQVDEAMRTLDMETDAYLSQLKVIQEFDSTGKLDLFKAEGKVLGNLGFVDDDEDRARRVMVLAGRTDILIPVVLSRELAERIEGCQFVTVKGGHACMWEFPDDFNKAVIRFLDEFRLTKS